MEKDARTIKNGSAVIDLHEAIRRRAEEIYIASGRIPGHDLENWAQAEKEVRGEEEASGRRMAIVVKVKGINHVGEYRTDRSDGYTPGEFSQGEPVEVRIEGDRMFVRRTNGKELETRIVRRVS